MERLTHVGTRGEVWILDNDETRKSGRQQAAYRKLKDFEDAEEQGLLVRLPVNKNAEIYLISSRWTICSKCGSRFDEYNCIGCEYECDSKKEYYICITYLSSINVSAYANRFGKTIFLTREEAEKKLEEMKK